MAKIHLLKCWPEYYQALETKEKTFEVRKNDREFKVGDILWIRPFDPETQMLKEGWIWRKITYLLPGAQFGIEAGFCVMALVPPNEKDLRKILEIINEKSWDLT